MLFVFLFSFHYCTAVGKAYFWTSSLQHSTICMRMKGENQGRRETQKPVLTSNQICCIDFATLALEQIRGAARFPRGSPERSRRRANGRAACAHTRGPAGARPSAGMRRLRQAGEALITEAAGATRSPFPAR